jgi:hypothetical protein
VSLGKLVISAARKGVTIERVRLTEEVDIVEGAEIPCRSYRCEQYTLELWRDGGEDVSLIVRTADGCRLRMRGSLQHVRERVLARLHACMREDAATSLALALIDGVALLAE